jgi:hypothetical protein
MTRPFIIVVGVIAVLGMQHVPAPDSMTAFAVGGFVGIILGAVLGVAFVYGERERPQREPRR